MTISETRVLMILVSPVLLFIILTYPFYWSFKTGVWELVFPAMKNGFHEFGVIWSKGL